MQINEFDYKLPLELIAQNPLEKRDDARLMVLDRINKSIEHKKISDLPGILNPNTVLFFNNTLVFPARLYGEISQKKVEILLHQEKSPGKWECLVRPGKRFRVGTKISWPELEGTVIEINEDGSRLIEFSLCGANFTRKIDAIGQVPLPPYIKKSTSRPDQYQTIYAQKRGSVAAPTAGLHFTPDLMKKLTEKGIDQFYATLHVGRGTFEPVKVKKIEDHQMHHEWFQLSVKTAEQLNLAKKKNKKIFAVGTTSARILESCAKNQQVKAKTGTTNLFIFPGYKFQFIDGLLTNFHLPKSTLLMLVSALVGKEFIKEAYQEAIRQKYRFFSFGDAMLIK
ncbi:MAG: S-adenosylmethionine/tRNA-ribosyltransferase-isomerase, S-adenosylmethionine:tRNA ribosyltransferase-isomerase [Candidatus Peregrinibacteria bacterium GW2011_GWF2_39_17]|nr:MAG: S-adenosylmethionine/tRNA-ribosyltransferase-isomerase, S-adenosylmethionine:tRNA ribosyltransferase-isomerase [Candidatus Peregrinibacteria bacterium GW2011_GWF2_39_17]HCW32074.1 tRNA preQ1(34) S-adenosylmethionine ribosyltransferase-isomerase QueA [Candidatus Peregrinibacteria bacterium]